MAAPLMVRNRMVGVVYVDSRLAKAMFNQEDVNLLLGISNHIAIAVETARTARLEADRAALARDLEILRVVQNLLLPKTPVFEAPHLRGASFYQAAAQCGGDWWWHRTRPDGTTIILVGDVSGHGAGPAMLTSAVSGTFQALSDLFPEMSPPAMLEHLSNRVKSFSGYHMTMSMAVVYPSAGKLSWWNAAGPEIYLIRDGKSTVINAPGTVLGTAGTLKVGYNEVSIAAGDRVLMCTDGVLELRHQGRMLGSRQTSKMFASYRALPIADACARMGADLNSMLVGQQQEDDITFVMFEIAA
jgi:serine phosphatase RsbU (regulator of sigma subunit)